MSLNLGSLGMEDASFNFGGSYIMALGCGTTSVLAAIVDEYGCIVAQARRSVKTSFPRPGWVEQDPTEVLASQIGVMMEVQFKSGIHSDRIAAIGISNQRETTVVWDRVSGQPIYNAIVWQCRRTAPAIDALVEQGCEELVRSRTGLTLDPYFSASKVQWILDNVDGARESAAAGDLMFGTIDTWLIYNLTGGQVFATDYTNASRTALFNIHTLDWDDDLLALEKSVTEVGREFAAAEEVKTFVRANRNGKIADSYVSAAQLSDEEAKALMAGEMYGPVLKNNEWTMSRALDSKMVPDSVGVRHIVLPYAQEALADSLLTVLKKGGDFAQTAARYSVYDATAANGGEVGVLPFSAFTGEFAAALANARQGDIVKIASGDAIQLMQVYRADKPSKHVQVATITYPVEASAATRRDVHNQAGSFMVNAKGSAAAFADAASTAAVTPRVAAIAQGDRTIRGLEDSREVARWAYGAKEGDLSAIFNVGKDYVIATLTEIDDNEYAPLNKVSAQIRSQLLRDKKYDYIVKSLSGSTLAEQAASLGSEVEDFSDVTFGSFYVNGVGMEPRLVGAIASAEKGALSAPVKGLSGVYVFEVGDVKTDDKQTAEGEKVRAQAMAEGMAQQFAIPAIQQMAKIQDLRGKYF
jgi:parvulin-like peptidyl-prolyl isomerase